MTDVRWDKESTLRWGFALSLLLHLLTAASTLLEYLPDRAPPMPEPAMEVELVKEAPRPQPPPPPPPPPPEPPPQAQTQPLPHDPVPVPQLRPGKLAEKSSAPEPKVSMEHGISERQMEARRAPAPGGLSQSAQDMILAQVLRMWQVNTAPLKGSDFTISITVTINPDGTLTDAMHKNAPWNPGAVIRGYNQMPDGYTKQALEGMLLALKMAQPLKLPPDDGKGWPRRMVIRFRPGDLAP